METPLVFLLTFLITAIFFSWIALGRNRHKQSAAEFAVAGRRAGRWRVSGAIMGTLVGGASTIGTVQTAYLYGLSGWWFTLGAGLACLIMALALAGPLRAGEVETVAGFIAGYYGERARTTASLFTSLGMFIHIIAQLLASGTLLSSLFDLPQTLAALIATILIALVAVGGGMRTAGTVGLIKLLLLYAIMISAGWLALNKVGGWSSINNSLPNFPWFSLFGYGVKEGLSDMLSMIVGVVSTQIYLQAIFSAQDICEARRGAIISAFLIPPLGLCGVVVGMAMRLTHSGIDSARALPIFILESFSPLWAGVAFATLLFATVATAAGLALGVGTTVQTDLLYRLVASEEQRITHLRWTTLIAIIAAFVLVLAQLDSLILSWSFLSMGIRGSTLFIPLLAAICLGHRTAHRAGSIAIIVAPLSVILCGVFWPSFPPLFLGLSLSFFIILLGLWLERNEESLR